MIDASQRQADGALGPGPPARALRPSRRVLLVLAIVVVAGALLRGRGLGEASLWHDELASWVAATRPATLRGVLEVSGGEDMHPPGYYLLLRMHALFFGDSEASLRLPSAVAGTLAIAALFGLGTAFYGAREGLIAAVLCAVLPFPVRYSQEARAYSLLFLGAIATAWLLMRARARIAAGEGSPPLARPLASTPGDPPWLELAAFAAAATVVAYLHYFGMLLVGLESLAALLLVRRSSRRRVAAAILVTLPVVLAALWLPWMSLAMVRQRYWPQPPSWRTPLRFFDAFFFGWKPLSALMLAAMAAAAAVFVARALRRRVTARSPSFATVVCLLWIVLPFVVLLGYSWLRHSIVVDRAMIIVLPPLYLLAARSVTYLLPRTGGQIAATLLLVGFAGARWATSGGYRDLHPRQDYRGATAALQAAVAGRPDALAVALVVAPSETPLLTYYLDRHAGAQPLDVVVNGDDGLRELNRVLRERAPLEVVLFCQLPRLLDRTTTLVESRYDLVEREAFGGRLELRRYALRGTGPSERR
jgi:mannosyltransferase